MDDNEIMTRCESCGEYIDAEYLVIVRGIVPDINGNIVLLNVCDDCAPGYEADPILTRRRAEAFAADAALVAATKAPLK
jgi:ribosome-binding protein aMBF1 (putative translation factor)